MDLFAFDNLLRALPIMLLAFCRMIALLCFAPLFAEKVVSVRLRVAIALLLSVVIALPMADQKLRLFSLSGIGLIINQCVIGAAIGLSMQCIFAAIRLGGEVIALQMGLSFASFYDAGSHSSLSVIARLLTYLSLLLFVNVDGLLWILSVLFSSFEQLPYSQFHSLTEQFLGIAQLGGTLFLQALQLSLPLIFMLLAVNLALGLLNRMTPQFSAFVIGFPLTLMIGIFALYQSMPLLIEMFQHMKMTLGQQLILFFSAA